MPENKLTASGSIWRADTSRKSRIPSYCSEIYSSSPKAWQRRDGCCPAIAVVTLPKYEFMPYDMDIYKNIWIFVCHMPLRLSVHTDAHWRHHACVRAASMWIVCTKIKPQVIMGMMFWGWHSSCTNLAQSISKYKIWKGRLHESQNVIVNYN